MTARIGIRELRRNLSKAIERARSGETIEVTKNGEPVARIVAAAYPTKLDQLVAEGRATRGRQGLEAYLRSHPPRPSTTGITAGQAIQEDRGE